MPFEAIRARIEQHQGEDFHTKTGVLFSYTIVGDYLIPSRTDYRISFKDIETAFSMLPIDGPGVINNVVRGPAYIWAILHDNRINQ